MPAVETQAMRTLTAFPLWIMPSSVSVDQGDQARPGAGSERTFMAPYSDAMKGWRNPGVD